MGSEQLEDSEFEPMFDGVKKSLGGKKVGLFGSYGWGDGEWMRNWEDDCKACGINLAAESVLVNNAPEADGAEACKALGAALVG
jgi:flavorubredoxin